MKRRILAGCLIIILILSTVCCTKKPEPETGSSASVYESTVSESESGTADTEAAAESASDLENTEDTSPADSESNSTETGADGADTGTETTESETESAPDTSGEYSRALAKKNQEYHAEDVKLTGISIDTQPEKRWTVMVYMIGSNLESSLGAASNDIAEMEDSGIDFSESNLILYTGGSTRWQSDIPCDRNSILDLSRDQDDWIIASTEKNADMGAKETLTSFVNFCTEYYPAEHTALILWDHGGGPLWGYGADELFGGDGLLLSEMQLAMDATDFAGIRDLDFVGFDACMMGCLENMAVWSRYADYYVGSEELEPGDGWDYHFLRALNDYDEALPVCTEIVDCFEKYYDAKRSEYSNPDLTLSVCDLSGIQPVVAAISDESLRLSEIILRGGYPTLTEVRYGAQSYGQIGSREEGTGYDYDLVDIGSFFTRLCEENGESPDENAVLHALSKLVVKSYSNMDQSYGVSLYYPLWNRQQYFETREFYKNLWNSTAYSDFLQTIGKIWQSAARKDWQIESEDTGEEYTVQLSEEQQEEMISANYSIFLSEHPGQYRPILLDCEIAPDQDGVLHLTKDPALIALTSGNDSEIWPVTQTESTKKRRIYQTKGTELCASGIYFYSRYNIDRDPVSVILKEDVKSDSLSVVTVNSASEDLDSDGRETVNVGVYDAICYAYNELIPSFREDGELMPVSSWETGDYTGKTSLTLGDSFGFTKVRSSEVSGDLYYVVSITDVNGSEYLTEPFLIEPERAYETVRTETPEGVLTAAVYADHAVLLSYEGNDLELTVPGEFGGVPLTAIGPKAFFKRINMDYVGVGEHYPLLSLTLPDSVREIGHAAFYMCADLQHIVLPKGLELIGTQAFSVCVDLQEITLPDSLRSIGDYAFSDCATIQTVTLPDRIESVGKGIFACCEALSEIRLSDENEYYCVTDSGLYTKDHKTMIAFPAALTGSASVHEDTEEIGADCFSWTHLDSLSLPEGLLTIRNYAFYKPLYLEMPKLPESLQSVGYNAFGHELMDLTSEYIHSEMQQIHIGKNLTEIQRGAFMGIVPRCFTVDPDNPRFSGKDGALLTKSGDSLTEFSVLKERVLVVPEGVRDLDLSILTQVGQYDMWSDKTTSDIFLPDSMIRMTGIFIYRDSMIFHCSPGTYADDFATRYGIMKSNDIEPPQSETEIPTENGSLVFYLTENHAGLQLIKGTDERIEIPAEVAGRPVTIIGTGEYSLYGKWNYFTDESDVAREIILPETVEVIADQAFFNVKLSTINLPKNLRVVGSQAFSVCREHFTALPAQLEKLGREAFSGVFEDCGELLIPKTLRDIESGAFEGMTVGAFVLEDTESPDFCIIDGMIFSADGKTLLHGVCPDYELVIPEGTEEIGPYAFSHQRIASLTIPSSVRLIGDYAFNGSYSLEEIHFSEGLEELGAGNFNSGYFTEIDFPESLRVIGDNCFQGHGWLERISLHAEVIGEGAFSFCSKLKKIDFGENLVEIKEGAFSDIYPEQIVLPASLRKIGNHVLATRYGDRNAERYEELEAQVLLIPENLQEIGVNCFTCLRIAAYEVNEKNTSFSAVDGMLMDGSGRVLISCPGEKTGILEIPEGVFAIGKLAFALCDGLEGIVIPQSVTVIRSYAFSDRLYRDLPEEPLTLYVEKDSSAYEWAFENNWPWTETVSAD